MLQSADIGLELNEVYVYIWLYADDMVLFPDSGCTFVLLWRLEANIDKPKAVLLLRKQINGIDENVSWYFRV